MSEDRKELAVEVAAVLDEFAAAQRALALTQTNKQRIVLRRNVGTVCEITLEKVVDADASAEDLYDAVAPINAAIDRLANKVELAGYYEKILNLCGQIDVAEAKYQEMTVEYRKKLRSRNSNRRTEVGLNDTQINALEGQRTSIKAIFERIEETKKAAAECRRIITGEDPFDVLAQQIDARLDKLRGMAAESAAA